jgi:hypothetical protein
MRNRFHALCPYFAMFPEAFAERWIHELSREGDVVLDPFSGRGTAPFQALLMGRRAIAVDKSPVAYCVTQAKLSAPRLDELLERISRLANSFERGRGRTTKVPTSEFFRFAYHPTVLTQLVFLRRRLRWKTSNVDRMLTAMVLGLLHGEKDRSCRYLSNQMPHVIATKPAYSVRYWREKRLKPPVRDAFALLFEESIYRYASPLPMGQGQAYLADMRQLPSFVKTKSQRPRLVITSPPYLDVTDFSEDQWLRLWFLGGPERPVYSRKSSDNRHSSRSRYWLFIADMWRVLGAAMAPRSNVVIRIGGRRADVKSVVSSVNAARVFAGRRVELVSWTSEPIVRRQTDSFRPGSSGCKEEVDIHFSLL